LHVKAKEIQALHMWCVYVLEAAKLYLTLEMDQRREQVAKFKQKSQLSSRNKSVMRLGFSRRSLVYKALKIGKLIFLGGREEANPN